MLLKNLVSPDCNKINLLLNLTEEQLKLKKMDYTIQKLSLLKLMLKIKMEKLLKSSSLKMKVSEVIPLLKLLLNSNQHSKKEELPLLVTPVK